MQKIKTSLGDIEAWKVLATINEASCIAELRDLDWSNEESKIDILTGKKSSLHFVNAYPLSETEALQALKEFRENY